MPYIHIDYSQKHLDEEKLRDLVAVILEVSAQAFSYTHEQALELVSIFCTPFNPADHSIAAAEIEVKAKIAEFDDPTKSRAEIREERMQPYKDALQQFISQNQLAAGIVFTITFQDWSVAFLPASAEKEQ